MTTKHIRVTIVYHGRYCDEQECRMWSHPDSEVHPFCAAFGTLERTKGSLVGFRMPRSIRDAECIRSAYRLTEDGEQ